MPTPVKSQMKFSVDAYFVNSPQYLARRIAVATGFQLTRTSRFAAVLRSAYEPVLAVNASASID
jgi:hypothetical protein